jgi:hypothetical protein
MGSAGVVRALAGALATCAISAASAGCGSAASSASAQTTGAIPGASTETYEPPAAAASGDPFAAAIYWPITPGRWSSLSGQLRSTGQIDVYDVGPVYAGDQLHVEVVGSGTLDAAVAVLDRNQDVLLTNDDRSYYGGLVDPLAKAIILHGSDRCYVAVAVSPKAGAVGSYTLQVLLTEDLPPAAPDEQVVYLNFDGAEDVIIGTRPALDVPPFDAALIDSSYDGHTAEIIDNLVAMVRQDYAGLNVRFHSSWDGPPPAEPHTTLHFGQFDAELLGVAENVDEYNLAVSQEAIIFTDTFAAFSVLEPSVEEISQALANVTSHETGHLLGLYHCADARALMDVTASLRQMLGDQAFMRAPLHDEYFPAGYQDSLQTLAENVGGDLVAAKEASAFQLGERSRWYDQASGPPARSRNVFSTCPRCLHRKADRYQRLHRCED